MQSLRHRQDARMRMMHELRIQGDQAAVLAVYDQFSQENQAVTDAFHAVAKQVKKQTGSVTAREGAKEITKFITEAYLEGKTCSILFGFFGKIGTRGTQWLQDCKKTLKPAQIEERLLTTPEGFEIKLSHDTFEEFNFQRMVAEDASSGAPTIIDVRNVEIHNPGELAALEAKWLAEFKNGPKHPDVPNYPENLRLDHVFGIEGRGKQLPNGSVKIYDWSGFHHDIGQIFETQGLIQIPKIKIHPHDIIETDIIYKGILQEGKTHFHPSWSRNDIMQNVLEVYRNPTTTVTPKGGVLIIEGFSMSGQKIRIITNSTGKRFISIFPRLK